VRAGLPPALRTARGRQAGRPRHRRYLLSPQDLAALDELPELIRLGIASLKIEGRLKSAEYVAAITRAYRQAVDRLMTASAPSQTEPAERGRRPSSSPPASESAELATLHREHDYPMAMAFSRGLHSGWFGGTNNQALVHANFGTKRGVFLGEVARVGSDRVALRLVAALKPGDGLVFDAGKPEDKEEGGRVYQVETHGAETVLRFGDGDIDFRRVHVGDRVWKTSDPALEKRIRQTFQGDQIRFQRPVTIEVHGCAGTPLTVIMNDGSGHVVQMDSLIPLEPAKIQPLTAERLREQLGRLGGTPYRLDRFTAFLEGEVILPVSELNRLRRELVTELGRLRAQPLRWQLNDPANSRTPSATARRSPPSAACRRSRPAAPTNRAIHNLGRAAAHLQTRRGMDSQQVRSAEADGYLVRNYDHLAFFRGRALRGDYSLNVANPLAAVYFLQHTDWSA
jgi:putative protease